MFEYKQIDEPKKNSGQVKPECRVIAFLSLQSGCLPFHVFDDNIEDFAERGAVFENFPGAVGVKVKLDERFVANGEQAVPFKGRGDVVEDVVLAELLTREQKLGVIFEFEHVVVSFDEIG
jgi:hypothetical protein